MSATSLPISRVHAPGGGSRDELAAIGVVWHRELLRFGRNRLRMVTSLVQPLLFLFILGSGLSNMLPSSGDVNFKTLGRAGARCRRCRRTVSPTRPPNRTCPFLSIRLSTGHAMAGRDAGFRHRRSPAGWWPVLFRWSSPMARGSGGRDSDIGSPAPRMATRAACLHGWSSRAPSIVA